MEEGIKRTTIRRQRVSNKRQKVELGVISRNFTSGTARNYTPVNSAYQAPKIGQRMVLYQGMRTANCSLLRDETLSDYHAIQILPDGQIFLDNQPLNETSALRLARLDGFLTVDAMITFFEQQYGLPFGDNERPADMLQWSVHTQNTLWYGLDLASNHPYRSAPFLKTNCDRVMVYEGPFEKPQLCDLPYIMCGLPKNWERLASRDLLDTINSVVK